MAIAHAISTTERLALILRSISFSQQTGCLSIEPIVAGEGEKGEIFFVNGDTVYALTEHESGSAAISQMLCWQEVRYAFFAGVQAPAQQLKHNRLIKPLLQLSHQAEVEMEETLEIPSLKVPRAPATPQLLTRQGPVSSPQSSTLLAPPPQVARKIGSSSAYAIFRARPHATTPDVLKSMERRERIVLLLLNGKRTLRAVAQLVHRSEVDIAYVLVRLLQQGYIEFMGPEKTLFASNE